MLMKLNSGSVRFLFDGERISETQTPKDVSLEAIAAEHGER